MISLLHNDNKKSKYSEAFIDLVHKIREHLDENQVPKTKIFMTLLSELHHLKEEDFSITMDVFDMIWRDLSDQYLKGELKKSSFERAVDLQDESKKYDWFFSSLSSSRNDLGGVGITLPVSNNIFMTFSAIIHRYVRKDKLQSCMDEFDEFMNLCCSKKIPGKMHTGFGWKGKNFFFCYKLYPFWPLVGSLVVDLEHRSVTHAE